MKKRQRAERDGWPEFLVLPGHRGLSWLERAERCSDDDGRFAFLWIGFNVTYAAEAGGASHPVEAQRFTGFCGLVIMLSAEFHQGF